MPVFEMPLEELRHYKGCSRVPVILRNIGAKRSESWRPRGLLIPVRLLRLRRRA